MMLRITSITLILKIDNYRHEILNYFLKKNIYIKYNHHVK